MMDLERYEILIPVNGRVEIQVRQSPKNMGSRSGTVKSSEWKTF